VPGRLPLPRRTVAIVDGCLTEMEREFADLVG